MDSQYNIIFTHVGGKCRRAKYINVEQNINVERSQYRRANIEM